MSKIGRNLSQVYIEEQNMRERERERERESLLLLKGAGETCLSPCL